MIEQLEDIMVPTYDNLLVDQDHTSAVVGVGLNGGDLLAPERHAYKIEAGKLKTGVVMAAGWDAIRMWPQIVGLRIGWQPYNGTVMKPGEADRRTHLKLSDVTCCFLKGLTDGPIDETWAELLFAKPGTIIVERTSPPRYRGSIHIPDGIWSATRQSEAMIISVGAGVDRATFYAGRSVFLPAECREVITLGERTFYQVYPNWIVGIFKEKSAGEVEMNPPSPEELMVATPPVGEVKFDEGDPRAPR